MTTKNPVCVEEMNSCLECGKPTKNRFCSARCVCHYLRPPGCKRSEETKEKIRTARARQINSPENNPEIGKKISKAIKGRIPWNNGLTAKTDARLHYTRETGKRAAELVNSDWHKYHTEESIKKTLSVMSPTSIELKLTEIITKHGLPFKFVGTGEVIINGKIPDYININHKKQLIELFGNYWHSLERTGRNRLEEEENRIKIFEKYNYLTLVIWEDELEKDEEKLVEKIREFSANG